LADITAQVSASLDALTQEFDVISNNLANASTTGYKRRCNAFTKALEEQGAVQSLEGTSQTVLDFSQGNLVQTDRTLDFALHGKGFFVIETPDGPLYTRHGVFQINQNGQIVDMSGRVVAGTAGPITLPAEIDSGTVHVASDGRVSAGDTAIGQLRVVEFGDSENRLIPTGNTCFLAPADLEPADAESPVVRQGYQEASNVKLVDELVSMIMVSRLYESSMRLVSVNRETSNSMLSVAMG